MKKIVRWGLMIAAVLFMVAYAQADQATPVAGTAPAASTTPVVKAKKAKKLKKKAAKKETKAVWVCPMGDYSGPKTADGKCPKCGMDLVQEK